MEAVKDRFEKFRKAPAFTGFVLFLAAILLNAAMQGPASFFSLKSINTLFTTNIPFLLVVMSQSILLISGTLDVSCGIQLALVNVVTIMTVQEWGIPFVAGCALGICAALIASLVCWVCVSVFRLPDLLASYALTYAIKGVNVLIMSVPQGKVEKVYYKAYDSLIGGFFPASAIALVIVLALWFYFSRTRFGTYIYAVGANRQNAFAAGINPVKVQFQAFMLKGVFVGIAGICITLLTSSGNPIQAEDYGIRSLAACIIGGLSFGGWGSMACGIFGGGFLILIQNSVYFFFNKLYALIPGFTVTSYWHNFISDIIIFLGLLMTIVTAKGQREALKINIKDKYTFKRNRERALPVESKATAAGGGGRELEVLRAKERDERSEGGRLLRTEEDEASSRFSESEERKASAAGGGSSELSVANGVSHEARTRDEERREANDQ